MTESGSRGKEEEKSPRSYTSELELYLKNLFTDEVTARNTAEHILRALTEMAQRIPGQVGSALKMLREFVQEFTNVKGVEFNLLFFRILDVQIHTMKEADVPFTKKLPVGKIEAIRLGSTIQMQVGLGEGNKDLQMNIKEGMSLVIDLGFLGKQIVPIKGSTKLTRDEKGELVIAASTNVPGTDFPVTVNIPLKIIVGEVRKQAKR
jgi:hypothetical protein